MTHGTLQYNDGLTTGGAWSTKFDATTFQTLTGTVPDLTVGTGTRPFRLTTFQVNTEKPPGYLLLLVNNTVYSALQYKFLALCSSPVPSIRKSYVFRTNDYGATWTYTEVSDSTVNPAGGCFPLSNDWKLASAPDIAVCQSPSRPDDVWVTLTYATGGNTILKSVNGGSNFSLIGFLPVNAATVTAYDSQIQAVHDAAGCDLYVYGNLTRIGAGPPMTALSVSSDGGASFTDLSDGAISFAEAYYPWSYLEVISTVPGRRDRLIAGGASVAENNFIFFQSDNKYSTYTTFARANPYGVVARSPMDLNRLAHIHNSYIFDSGKFVHYSNDFGVTWKNASGNLEALACSRAPGCYQTNPRRVRWRGNNN